MAENNTEGRWVTLDNGVHLFIKKGQTLDDAIEKLDTGKSEKKTDAKKWAENFQKNLNKTDEQKKKEQEKTITDTKEYWEKEASTSKSEKDREYAKKQLDKFAKNVKEGKEKIEDEDYKGYKITHHSTGDYSVESQGFDVLFGSKEAAKAFIDSETDTEEKNDYRNLSAAEYGKKYGKTIEPEKSSLTREEEELVDYAIDNLEHGNDADELVRIMSNYYSEYAKLAREKPDEIKEYFNQAANLKETNTTEKDDYQNLSAAEYGKKYGKTEPEKKSERVIQSFGHRFKI